MSPGEMPLDQAREPLTFRMSWALAKALGMAELIVLTNWKETAPLFIGFREVGFMNTASEVPSEDAESQALKEATGHRGW